MFVTGPQKMLFSTSSDDVGVELRQHLLHEHARLHHAGLHAFAHVDDGLLEDHRRARRATQPVVVVLDGDERLRAGARAELRHRIGDVVELVDRQQPVGKLEFLERRLAVEREDLVRQPVLPGEAVGARWPARARSRYFWWKARSCSSNSSDRKFGSSPL